MPEKQDKETTKTKIIFISDDESDQGETTNSSDAEGEALPTESNQSYHEDEHAHGQKEHYYHEESDASEYSLLSEDDEEELIGSSLNAEHILGNGTKKYIPGNKIHRQLSSKQNSYREDFYGKDKASPRKSPGTMDTYWENIKTDIISKQKDSRKKGDLKKETLEGIMGKPWVSTIKPIDGRPKVYPNFGAAKLSYLKEGKIHSKFLNINREVGDGHSEVLVFSEALEVIKEINDADYSNPDLILLDIHTLMSMCGNCTKEAENFLEECKKLGINIKIRVSYHFPYGTVTESKEDSLTQTQIELPESHTESKSATVNSVVISSGHREYLAISNSVRETDVDHLASYADKILSTLSDEYNDPIPDGYRDVPADGWCFYHAVLENYHGDEDYGASTLHEEAINHILSNIYTYMGFFTELVPNASALSPTEVVNQYFNYQMRHADTAHDGAKESGAWADNLMIQAVANVLDRNIEVRSFENADYTTQITIVPSTGSSQNSIIVGNLDNFHFVAHDPDEDSDIEELTSGLGGVDMGPVADTMNAILGGVGHSEVVNGNLVTSFDI